MLDNINYSDPEIQSALIQMHLQFEKLSNVNIEAFTSWIRSFDNYLGENSEVQAVSDNEVAFISKLQQVQKDNILK